MEPKTPPGGAAAKKKRQRAIIIGAAAAALLLLLYMRSRSAAASSAPANATSSQDLQNAYVQGAQQGALSSGGGFGSSGAPSTFADNGANAAALGDAVTSALSTFETQQPSWYVPPTSTPITTGDGSGAPAAAPTVAPAAAPTVTVNINNTGPHTAKPGTGTKTATNTKKTNHPGGGHATATTHHKPTIRKTGTTSHKQPRRKRR